MLEHIISFLSQWYGILLTVLSICLLYFLCYRIFFKRFTDILLSGIALIILSPLMLFIAILVQIKFGKPIVFRQYRPGRKDKIFALHKFRTMTDDCDEHGKLLPDQFRMTRFGKWLRSTSLDELPELWDIFRGKMSLIGPRPQLVCDLVFMDCEVRKRHSIRPGLTGLAQVNGRNNLTWEDRFRYDLFYVNYYNLLIDVKILFQTILRVIKKTDVTTEGLETSEDYGDYLLRSGRITKDEYNNQHELALRLLEKKRGHKR